MAFAAAPPPPAYIETTDQACHARDQVTLTSQGEAISVTLNVPQRPPPSNKPQRTPPAEPVEVRAKARSREAGGAFSGAPIAVPGV